MFLKLSDFTAPRICSGRKVKTQPSGSRFSCIIFQGGSNAASISEQGQLLKKKYFPMYLKLSDFSAPRIFSGRKVKSQLSGSNYSCIAFQGVSNDVLSSCVRCIYFVSLSFENYIPTVTYWVADWLLRNPVVATIIFIGVSL